MSVQRAPQPVGDLLLVGEKVTVFFETSVQQPFSFDRFGSHRWIPHVLTILAIFSTSLTDQ